MALFARMVGVNLLGFVSVVALGTGIGFYFNGHEGAVLSSVVVVLISLFTMTSLLIRSLFQLAQSEAAVETASKAQ